MKDLLAVYGQNHRNDLPGGPQPETGKFPPLNESMMIAPPTLREWKSTQQQQPFNIFGANPVTPSGVFHRAATLPPIQCNELVGLTFKAEWNDEEEISVMVEGNLNMESTMEDVMKDGDVNSELGCDENVLFKYLIQKQSGGKLTLKWNKFKTLTVKRFTEIKSIHEDYIIIIRKIV